MQSTASYFEIPFVLYGGSANNGCWRDGGFPQGNGTDLLIPCPAVLPGAGARRSSSSHGEAAAKGTSVPGPLAGTWEGKEPVPRAPSPPPVAAGAAGGRPQHRDNGGGDNGGQWALLAHKGSGGGGIPRANCQRGKAQSGRARK